MPASLFEPSFGEKECYTPETSDSEPQPHPGTDDEISKSGH